MNIYDFDKTIYLYDSQRKFYSFLLRTHPKLWWHIFKVGLWGLGRILGIVTLKKFKEKFFSILKYIGDIDKEVTKFWDREIKNIHEWYIKKKREDDVICSASPKFLLDDIISRLNPTATLVCSNIDKKTGKFENNEGVCRGKEKEARLLNLKLSHFSEGYGNSRSDIFMLKMCDKKFKVKKGKIYTISC